MESPKIEDQAEEVLEIETKTSNTDGQPEIISKRDCTMILELLKTPTLREIMTEFSAKEAVIIMLKLGYVDNKHFSTESIAEFLGITTTEVRESVIKILNLYKKPFIDFIEQAPSQLNDDAFTGTSR